MKSLPQHIPTLLRDIYYTARDPASFSSAEKLYQKSKTFNPFVTRKEVKEYLESQFPYTLHHRIVRRFKRNPIIVSFPLELLQADLVDLQSLSKANDNVKFLLTVIDAFSRKAYVFPLKNKSGAQVKQAFELLFKQGVIPSKIQTDSGREFLNSEVQSLFKKYEVKFQTATNELIKCAIVERLQRTLQSKLYKYMTATGSDRYIDILKDVVDGYNDSVHTSIGLKPNDVSFANNEVVFRNLYGVDNLRELLNKSSKGKKSNLKVGDTVRVGRTKDSFRKGYVQTFSDELYRITHISKPIGLQARFLYKLQSVKTNRLLRRRFYQQELVRVSPSVKTYERAANIRLREERRGTYGYV